MADGSVGIKLLGVNLRTPFNLSFQGFGFREVNSTFQGQSEPFFLGLIPVLTIFDELEGGDRFMRFEQLFVPFAFLLYENDENRQEA